MNTVELDTDIISIILIGMLSLSDTSAIHHDVHHSDALETLLLHVIFLKITGWINTVEIQ